MTSKTKKSGGTGEMPGLEELLCFAVYSAGHAFNRVYKPLLQALDLTYPQYITLVALWREDGQTVGGLGDKLFLESNTLTPLLKRLEALGFVRRQRSAEDERQVRVFLTDKGRALEQTARDVPPCILEATGMEAKDLSRLTGEVTRLRDALRR